MKKLIKYSTLFLVIFSFQNIFAEEAGNTTKEIAQAQLTEEEQLIEFSLAWGYLTAQMFKEENPFSKYYNGREYLKGIDNYLNGIPCDVVIKAWEAEFAKIMTDISTQKTSEKEQTKEEIAYRSQNFGWHAADDITTNYSNRFILNVFVKGVEEGLNGGTSPLSIQKTMELYNKYIAPLNTNKISEESLEKNQKDFEKMIHSDSLVVMDFYSDFCPPCKQLKPILEELESEGLTVCFLNATDYLAFMQKEKITSIPTIWIYKDGKKVEEFVGFRSKEQIQELLEKFEV